MKSMKSNERYWFSCPCPYLRPNPYPYRLRQYSCSYHLDPFFDAAVAAAGQVRFQEAMNLASSAAVVEGSRIEVVQILVSGVVEN